MAAAIEQRGFGGGPGRTRARVVLAEADPRRFLDSFFKLLRQPVDLALVDPGLPGARMKALLKDLSATRAMVGPFPPARLVRLPEPWKAGAGWTGIHEEARVWVATGGTTGGRRFAVHSKRTLQAAAEGFGQVFPGPADSLCVLPLWHVGGLMQVARAALSGGRVRFAEWRAVASGEVRPQSGGSFVSLVPAQLERLIGMEAEGAVGSAFDDTASGRVGSPSWLRGFRAVFLGGGPARKALLEQARRLRIPLAPAYGMTETAAQVTVLMPEAFLTGASGVGRALPHADLSIVDEAGRPVPPGEDGIVRVRARSLFLGYDDGSGRVDDGFLTNDLGRMSESGELSILGRLDEIINTGGEKVVPAEVEAALIDSGLAADAVVFGRPDPRWGEVVCAAFEGGSFADAASAREVLRDRLAAFQIPKEWIRVPRLPRNAMGKLDRSGLEGLSGGRR